MIEWKSKYIGVEEINIAVRLYSKRPESKHANIGISLPGTNESLAHLFLLMAKK